MKTSKRIFLIILVILPGITVAAKKSDSTDSVPVLKPYHKNTIKWNPTPMLIWGEVKNLTFSYERVVNPKQSFSVQLGYLVYGQLFKDTIAYLISLSDRQKYGVNISVDYRFYPIKRNRMPTPSGLYIGPYFSYYGNHFENKFDILHTSLDQDGQLACNINMYNLGFELGYQFIFWKRLSVDLIMFGPSLSMYTAKLSIKGDLDESQINEINDAIAEKIINRFPAVGYIFSEEGLVKTGTKTQFGAGFRYSFQIGFHF